MRNVLLGKKDISLLERNLDGVLIWKILNMILWVILSARHKARRRRIAEARRLFILHTTERITYDMVTWRKYIKDAYWVRVIEQLSYLFISSNN